MHPDASLIRIVLARECETVNEYEALAARAQDETTRNLLLHLAHEEKEHIAECALFLAQLDSAYKSFLEKPLDHALGGSTPIQAPKPEEPTHPKLSPYGFTVGSLIERPEGTGK